MCTNGSNEKLCKLLEYDDSKCTNIAKCCVGISDQGDHAKCTSAARECRKFGTTWEPRRPMKPLPFEYMYNESPGYATTGQFVENFDGSGILSSSLNFNCLLKNFIYALILTAVFFCAIKKPLEINELAIIALVTSFARCVLF